MASLFSSCSRSLCRSAADSDVHGKVASSQTNTNCPLQNIKAVEQRKLESFDSSFSAARKSE